MYLVTGSVLGSEGIDSHTVPAFKGLPKEIGYENRSSPILGKTAIREAQRICDGNTLWESSK